MSRELESLSQQLSSCVRDRGGRRRVPVDLRRRIVAVARSYRSEGQSWSSLAVALGVHSTQLQRWVATAPEASFAEVELTRTYESGYRQESERAGLTLRMPSGVELRGLSYEQAESLLASLS